MSMTICETHAPKPAAPVVSTLAQEVAVEIFGWQWVKDAKGERFLMPGDYGRACGNREALDYAPADGTEPIATRTPLFLPICAEYDTRINLAWWVVEEMEKRGVRFAIRHLLEPATEWHAGFEDGKRGWYDCANGATAPEAICLAALNCMRRLRSEP